MNIPILAYHKVDNHFEWGINTVSTRLFEKQIKFLAKNGFTSTRLDDCLTNQIECKKPIIITFDDSYKSIFKYAFPILQKYGFIATIFVISEYVGKKNIWDINLAGKIDWHLSWDEIRDLKNWGWEIGSHTATHPDLTKLTHNELVKELSSSKYQLEKQLGIPVNLISYPFNRFNNYVIKLTKELGYKGGCCLANNNSIPQQLVQFSISRKGVYTIDELFWFKLKLQHNAISKIDDIRQKIICFCSRGSIYYTQLKNKKNVAN